jgi:asparagine synthase (glutamine-hydrolysing)
VCGVSGFLDTSGRSPEALAGLASAMSDTLEHRGPDDEGIWIDAEAGIGLGVRRLAVLDLSPHGHQPMISTDARYVLVYNGEIYNFRELRAELQGRGHRFRGGSDTEVVLASVLEWGVDGALRRANGMFAFGLWDRTRRTLHLARDRLGEKPLYYGWSARTFLFASELKALLAHPDFDGEIDREALTLFFRYKHVPWPWSIYRGIRKLAPGTSVTVRAADRGRLPDPVAYWDLGKEAEKGAATPFVGSSTDVTDRLRELLSDSVRMRLEADVPLGALLSGGIDSSSVVALMQEQSVRPVQTFTVAFEEAAFDESGQAAAVAERLGTDHTAVTVGASDVRDVIPTLPSMYDEPFGGASQIPTHLLSRLARSRVTVALSGDGGDELFGGYNRHAWAWGRRLPGAVRMPAARALELMTPERWEGIVRAADPLLPERLRHRSPADKLRKIVDGLRAPDDASAYLALVSHWREPETIVVGGCEPLSPASDRVRWPAVPDFRQQMMVVDALTYLPDDVLTKVDRASMAVGLEVRAPFLDHRLVEFAWTLPVDAKIRGGIGKQPLRRLLESYLPAKLVNRPKMGFDLPLGDWLRGPLREWAGTLLDGARLREEGFVRPEPVQAAWCEHLSGRRNRQYEIWDVLIFETWLEERRARSRAEAVR